MSEGLTRRRGTAGPTSSIFSPTTTPPPGSPSIPQNHNNNASSSSTAGLAGSSSSSTTTPSASAGGSGAVEGRGKIAFDPRDYENGSMGGERERMPRLTVMEEVLLLGLKDKQVRV